MNGQRNIQISNHKPRINIKIKIYINNNNNNKDKIRENFNNITICYTFNKSYRIFFLVFYITCKSLVFELHYLYLNIILSRI